MGDLTGTRRVDATNFRVIEEPEALARVLVQIRPLAARDVPLADALHEFAAAEVSARLSLPRFDNSAMDGYAVVASSCASGAPLRVVGEQPAGADRRLAVSAGEAVRIFTGAPMPHGADGVVMQEDVQVDGSSIILQTDVAPGEFVRRRGGDVAKGQKVLAAGERIEAQTIALLAAQGVARVRIGGAVRAAIISTGDELKLPGATLEPGEIYESNAPLLRALLQTAGVAAVTAQHCADQREQIDAAIRNAAANSDVMIISGGVSVGAHDLVKPALAAAGASLDFWRVAVKPGKPFLFGRIGDCLAFGLPGNPVSAFVTLLLFVRPAILRLRGAPDGALGLRRLPAQLAEPMRNPGDRPHYVRGRFDRDGLFRPIGTQESHALFGLSRSNALLRLDRGQRVAAGEAISVLIWE
jgi:molybdopterin molybdotransferase